MCATRSAEFDHMNESKAYPIPMTTIAMQKHAKRAVRVLNDSRNRRDDKKDVAEERNSDRPTDRFETAPSCVCEVGTEQWNNVDPE